MYIALQVYNENKNKIISQVFQLRTVFKDLSRKDAIVKQDLDFFDDVKGESDTLAGLILELEGHLKEI